MRFAATPPDSEAVVYPETGLTVVGITGADATSFLDAQSSARLPDGEDGVGFGAFAEARGRVLLVFRVWRHDAGWRLLVPSPEAQWLHDYLSRFIFRARVEIAIERAWRIFGVAGASVRSELAHAGIAIAADGCVTDGDGFAALGLGHARGLLCGKPERTGAPIEALRARLPAGDENGWRLLRLIAGEPEIRAATRGRFLPQMLGLVELGAVSFNKGCYPGQEIIARIQHRGRIKRHLALVRWDAPLPAAGTIVRVDGQAIEALDGVALPDGRQWLQAVVPWPPAGELAGRVVTSRARETG